MTRPALRAALLLCALLANNACLTTEVNSPQDEVFVKGGRSLDGLPPMRGYDAAASALGAGARAEQDGRWEAARLAYNAVASHDPGNLRAVMARTRALLAEGKSRQAADLLMAADRSGPQDPQMLAATGSVLLAAGSAERAVEHLRTARQLQPHSQNTRHQLVAALLLAGHHEAVVEELAGTDPRDLPDHLLLPVGRSALLADRLVAAAACFEEAARREPASPVPWLELGRTHLLRQDLPGARDALLTALGLDPTSDQGFLLLGHVRWLAGDAVRAQRCWQTALLNGADPESLAPLLRAAEERAQSRQP